MECNCIVITAPLISNWKTDGYNAPQTMTYSNLKLLFFFLTATLMLTGCRTMQSNATRGVTIGVNAGGYVYYEEQGKGDAVILLHGHSLDRRMWQGQVPTLARHFRVITPDFRGYGRSSEMREDIHTTHCDDIIALMDSLHISRAHVVGLSMGAFVAGDMLAMHPERLISCTLCSGGIRNSPSPSEPSDSSEWAKREQEIAKLKASGIEQMKRQWTEQLIASGGTQRERMRLMLTQMIKDWSAWQPLHHEPRLFYGREAWLRLQSNSPVSVPLLVLRGETEGKTKNARELKYVSDGRQIVLPDCGHMMNMERPDEFNKVVLEFLSSHKR